MENEYVAFLANTQLRAKVLDIAKERYGGNESQFYRDATRLLLKEIEKENAQPRFKLSAEEQEAIRLLKEATSKPYSFTPQQVLDAFLKGLNELYEKHTQPAEGI